MKTDVKSQIVRTHQAEEARRCAVMKAVEKTMSETNEFMGVGFHASSVHEGTWGETIKGKPSKTKSDGSTADYYELPPGAEQLQDVISYKDMNSQMGEIFRACMRYGEVEHSPKMRDAKKILYYITAEIKRLKDYEGG